MQDSKGDGMPARCHYREEIYGAVVAELASVIEHIRKSRRMIESMIASDAAGEEAAADNVIVLDDVTPGYERVGAALRDCDAGLSVALRLLQGPITSSPPATDLPISA